VAAMTTEKEFFTTLPRVMVRLGSTGGQVKPKGALVFGWGECAGKKVGAGAHEFKMPLQKKSEPVMPSEGAP